MSLSQNEILIIPLPENLIEAAAKLERLTLEEEAWSAQSIRQTVQRNGFYFAAVCGEKLLGHGGFTFAADEGYITNIAVSPEARRQGTASKIIAEMLQKAKVLGLSFLSLEVRESNEAAIRLYEKMGFSVRGIRPKFYKKPTENAVIMTKDI